jgi:hypothetical protein
MYVVPESKRSLAQNQFEFTAPDGVTYRIPKAKYMKTGDVERLAAMGDQNVKITDLLDLFGEGAAAKAVRELDVEQLQGLMEAWQQDSGITVGESSASTPSS